VYVLREAAAPTLAPDLLTLGPELDIPRPRWCRPISTAARV